VPKTAKFTQEKKNGNLLRRESTPIKHGTLCLPEVLEQEANRTKIRRRAGNDNRTPLNRKTLFTLHLPALTRDSYPVAATLLASERRECGACITQGSLHLTCFTTGGVSVLIDMNLAHIVFFKGCRNTPLSRERLQNSCSKMAASATTTRISHISVISLHGSVAGSGSCCTGCVTSHG